MKICIAAGETSGDLLGASLIQALRQAYPDAQFFGVAGPAMQAEGCDSLFDMESLSVMGVAEVLPKIPHILRCKKQLVDACLQSKPDVFIGIDSPDFMLRVEKPLKQAGIKTVHVVSPSVWAWRKGRVKGIKKAVDLMLCLFEFEKTFYDQHGVKAACIGHPAAQRIARLPSAASLRESFGLSTEAPVLALLPGSRSIEIAHLGPLFLKVVKILHEQYPALQFILPLARPSFEEKLKNLAHAIDCQAPIHYIQGQSCEVMQASDIVLATSGTTTLEAMLMNKPMVVAYQMHRFNWWLGQLLVDIDYIALPNLLAKRKIVPEFIQDAATPEALCQALQTWLEDNSQVKACLEAYAPLNAALSRDAQQLARDEIVQLLSAR